MKRAIRMTGVGALLLCLNAYVQADEAKGTIKSVDTGRKEVVLKGTVKDTIYELNSDASLWLDGARAKLSDLAADDKAVVIFEKKGEHFMASTVRALRKAEETTGAIHDIVGDKREIVIKGAVKNTTYELTKTGTVWINGKAANLKDLKAGDQVLITYERRGEHFMAADVSTWRK